ncbi:MAG: hypothetical protein K6253_00210 [Candidatus Liberibacter asiaticus]|nr:hypothetical protein [Candidatus Liberibacter asiaticus]
MSKESFQRISETLCRNSLRFLCKREKEEERKERKKEKEKRKKRERKERERKRNIYLGVLFLRFVN